jgi:nucleoside-diphosphate-sugar epimerase
MGAASLKVVIIGGAGEVGFHVASHLALEHKDVVVTGTEKTHGLQNEKNRSNPVDDHCGRCRLSFQAAARGPGAGTLRAANSDQCQCHCGYGESR